jgi:Kae1-associated kinase Bud32
MTNKVIAQGAEAIITLSSAWERRDGEEKHFKRSEEQGKILKDYIGSEKVVIKNRIKKSYRIPVLDEKLRKIRTRSEAKIISKLEKIIPVPKIIKTDEKQEIIMQFIYGKKLSDNLENRDYKKICKLIADNITKMHNQGIIHGDLTTSNMIYVENSNNDSNKKSDVSLNLQQPLSKDLTINNKITAKSLSMRKQLSREDKSASEANADDQGKVYFIDFGLSFHSQKIEDKAVDLHLLQQALEAKHFTIWQECWKIILKNYKPEKNKEILQRIKIIESRGRYKDKY